MIIKKFNDNSTLEFTQGDFNNYQILYNSSLINGKWLLEKVKLFSEMINDSRFFNQHVNEINEISYLNSNNLETDLKLLEKIIDKSKNELNKFYSLLFEKMSYLIFLFFYAEDRWINPKTGNPSYFKRRIYADEIKRVGILNQDVDEVCNLYTGHTISHIENLIEETNRKILSKFDNEQKSLFDF